MKQFGRKIHTPFGEMLKQIHGLRDSVAYLVMILSPQTIQTEPYYSAKLNDWMDYKGPWADMVSIDSWATICPR